MPGQSCQWGRTHSLLCLLCVLGGIMEIRIDIFEAEEIIFEYLDRQGKEFIRNLVGENEPNKWIKFDEDNNCFVGFIVAP